MGKQKSINLDSRFKIGFLINSSFMLFEFVIGLLSGSLILIADAAHNLTDSVTLAISWISNRVAQKPADSRHSLGHGRFSVLAAFINSVILVMVALVIFLEAYQRFLHPQELHGVVIALVGAVGIMTNGLVAFLFRKDKKDLNVRAAYTNMLFDALFSLAALVAGLLIVITGRTWIDPLISIGVGIGLLYAALGILWQATHIFLEGVPKGVDLQHLKNIILEDQNIEDVRELAAWAISSNEYTLCCVIKTQKDDLHHNRSSIARLKEKMQQIGFTRVFVELE